MTNVIRKKEKAQVEIIKKGKRVVKKRDDSCMIQTLMYHPIYELCQLGYSSINVFQLYILYLIHGHS